MSPAAALITDALEAVFTATNNYHRSARALRNRLVIMTLVAVSSAAGLVVLQSLIPGVRLVAPPPDIDDVAAWQLLSLVMILGAMGALITTIKPLATMPTAFTPFNFPLQQAFIKIAVGTLTATIGVLAVTGVTNSDGLSSIGALLFAAAAFGAGQQSITRLLDDRASALISTNPSIAST